MNEGYWKQLRRLSRGTEDAVLSAHIPACWWHPQGIRKMVKRLEARGFPWLRGWLFFTMTIDPKKFSSETKAFEAGKDRLRRVICELRARGYKIHRWAFKLELQGNGWPHWHLLVDSREFISHDLLTDLWGYGTADVRRIKPAKWKYLFKYVVKGSAEIPNWILNYPTRIRVFQTSLGFFDKPSPAREKNEEAESDDAQETQPKPETLAEKFRRWSLTGHVRFRASIRFAQKVTLLTTFRDLIFDHVESGGRVIDFFNVPLSTQKLLQCIRTN